jgi:hypothetical protein
MTGTFRLAHVVIDRDMTFGVNFVCVETEFGFNVDGHGSSLIYPRIIANVERITLIACRVGRTSLAHDRPRVGMIRLVG